MPMKITSTAFQEGKEIPVLYTGEDKDISPPLAFSDIPANTQSLALIVDDPDAPDPAAPKMTWVHWVLFNLPPDCAGLAEAVTTLPDGTGEGLNDWMRTGYGGPMPPIGRHRYFFKLYALDAKLSLPSSPTKADVVAAMEGHILDQAVLMGTYIKKSW